MRTARTELLEITYLDEGPADGAPVLLLHGWPDDVRTWRDVLARLHAVGRRTIVPYLQVSDRRGSVPTRRSATGVGSRSPKTLSTCWTCWASSGSRWWGTTGARAQRTSSPR